MCRPGERATAGPSRRCRQWTGGRGSRPLLTASCSTLDRYGPAGRMSSFETLPAPGRASNLMDTARYTALVRVSEALRTYHEPEVLFRELARELRPVVRFSFLGLALVDEQTGVVIPHVLEATGERAAPPQLTSSDQLTHHVLDRQQPLVIPSVETESRFSQEMSYLRAQGAR